MTWSGEHVRFTSETECLAAFMYHLVARREHLIRKWEDLPDEFKEDYLRDAEGYFYFSSVSSIGPA